MAKNILTGNEAIEAHNQLQASCTDFAPMPKFSGYFNSSDCEYDLGYDKNSIVAFDSTDGIYYEDTFDNINDAIDWINN
jgi:hypothetical protein